MRLGRFSHQTGYTDTRRAQNINSRGGDISGDVNTTAADNENAQDAATPDQSIKHQDQSFNQPSSRLHQQDMHSLAQREYNISAKTSDSLIPAVKDILHTYPTIAPPASSTAATSGTEPPTLLAGAQSNTNAIPYSHPYSQLWVRIPYPLVSFVTPKPTIVQPQTPVAVDRPDDATLNPGTDEHHTYQYIAPPGWFNLGATQMRNMTVATLDEAGNAMWEGSRADKVPQPSEFF